MEHDFDLQSFQMIPSHCPLYLLDNTLLSTNTKFVFLKDKLEAFYTNQKSFHLLSINSQRSATFHKQLYFNLNSLLTEITLTKDPQGQRDLLEKAYKWYLDKVGISRSQNPSSTSLTSKMTKNHSIYIPKSQKKVKISKMLSNLHFPKKTKVKSRDAVIEKFSFKYQKMLEKEKIDFGVPLIHGFPDKKKKKLTISPHPEENLNETENNQLNKRPSRTPAVPYDHFIETELLNPIKDFKQVAHKFRIIKAGPAVRDIDQILYEEALEITEIKKRMAQKRMPVNVKTLEHGLVLHQQVKLNSLSDKRFPIGGEMLLKSYFPNINKPSPSASRKQQSP